MVRVGYTRKTSLTAVVPYMALITEMANHERIFLKLGAEPCIIMTVCGFKPLIDNSESEPMTVPGTAGIVRQD